tara:strand:- start:7499 stop:7624 length:126 start_codon:yes stop_codon:yes gene_type:complete
MHKKARFDEYREIKTGQYEQDSLINNVSWLGAPSLIEAGAF